MQDAQLTFVKGRGKVGIHFGPQHSEWLVRLVIVAASAACASAAEAAPVTNGTGPEAKADGVETVIRMYPTAVVAADKITLADVAEVEGEAAKLAASWPIGQAPKAGGSCIIDLAHVQKVLTRRGANLAYWMFRGHVRCGVTRPTRSAAGRNGMPGASEPRRLNRDNDPVRDSHPAGAGNPVEAGNPVGAGWTSSGSDPAPAGGLDPNTLGGVLHAYIAGRLSNIGGSPLIEFTPAVTRLLGLAKPPYDFVVKDRSDRLLGLVPLAVTIYEKDQVKQVLEVLAKVSLRKAVVVTAGQINRGGTIGVSDLEIEERVFDRIGAIGLTETTPLVGQRAKRFIKKGEQISSRDIEPVPLVRRNDLVMVIVRRGNLTVKGSARAVSAGGYGDVVELKNEMAKRSAGTFSAVVTGRKTAEIPAGNGERVAAPAFGKGDS